MCTTALGDAFVSQRFPGATCFVNDLVHTYPPDIAGATGRVLHPVRYK